MSVKNENSNECAYFSKMLRSEVSSRDARSAANLVTLSLDLTTFQTPLATFFSSKKATSDKSSDFLKNFSESLRVFL